jgi:hypothetical protein
MGVMFNFDPSPGSTHAQVFIPEEFLRAAELMTNDLGRRVSEIPGVSEPPRVEQAFITECM